MRRAASFVAACVLVVASCTPALAAPAQAKPAAPPRVLNIVRVRLKPRTAASYAALEAQIARAYERAKAPIYWICLQSPKDSNDVLYLNLADSTEAWDRTSQAYQALIKQHPQISELQDRLTQMTQSSTSTLTTHREDIDRAVQGVDFASMRALRLTVADVAPGREGLFLDAIRTSPATDGSWLVYESTNSSTYALITLTKTRLSRKDGPAVPRALRRHKDVVTRLDTKQYAVRQAMSHPAPAPRASTH